MNGAGFVLLVVGGLMMMRGSIYRWWPDGAIAEKRRRKNLRYGMTTDMTAFGGRLRRLGYLVALTGAWLLAWPASYAVPPAATPPATSALP
ncbi:MAG: hypothetical protein ACO3JL_06695 [Myxococcota bacterium]